MDRYARWNALLEILTESGRVSVEEAAGRLDVSQATIRRDFDQLAQQQMITRTRGGAVANGVSYDLPLRYKSAKHAPEKQRIGTAAAALVDPAMVVGLTGGVVRPQSFELVGPLGGNILRDVTLDMALLGVDALDIQLGAAAHHEGEAAMNSLMVARARHVVIIADSSKLGGHAFARICPIDRINTLVTDSNATPATIRAYEEAGLRVVTA